MLPSSTPKGTPTTAAIKNACTVRQKVTTKSPSSAPPSKPVTSVATVAEGGGSKMARIQPARTTRSHTINSASGPTKGSRRAQRVPPPVRAVPEAEPRTA